MWFFFEEVERRNGKYQHLKPIPEKMASQNPEDRGRTINLQVRAVFFQGGYG